MADLQFVRICSRSKQWEQEAMAALLSLSRSQLGISVQHIWFTWLLMEAAAPYTGTPWWRSVLREGRKEPRKGREGRSQGRKEGVSRCCFWRKEGKSEGRKGRSQGRRRKEGASPPAVHRARAAPPAGAGRYRGPGLTFLPHAADLRGHLRTLPGSGSWLVSGSCRIPEMALCVCCCCAWTVPAEELLSVMVSMHCWTSQLD